MPSVVLALVASVPLLLLPPGVCPCHVFGLECHDSLTPDRDGPDDQEHDCGCPKVKTLSAPGVPLTHTANQTLVLDCVPELGVAVITGEQTFPPVPLPRALADPSLYLTLRALRC
jgi:hypothetical protein